MNPISMNKKKTCFAVVLTLCIGSAWAQTYPVKPIRMVVSYAAGGVADLTARAIAAWFSESLEITTTIDLCRETTFGPG